MAAQAALDLIESLYGCALFACSGVVHIAAVFREPGGALRVLKIQEATPASAADAFALSLSRARADAILTTGAVLRAEPRLRVEAFGRRAPALLELRTAYGRRRPPALLVLTRGDLDLGHPALHGWAQPFVVTGRQGAAQLRPQLAREASIQLVELAEPTAVAAIAWARETLGAQTITVEAGPTTALPLYEAPGYVDELMLSVLDAEPPADVRGKPFVTCARLEARMGVPVSDTQVREASGLWRIQRWLRADSR